MIVNYLFICLFIPSQELTLIQQYVRHLFLERLEGDVDEIIHIIRRLPWEVGRLLLLMHVLRAFRRIAQDESEELEAHITSNTIMVKQLFAILGVQWRIYIIFC